MIAATAPVQRPHGAKLLHVDARGLRRRDAVQAVQLLVTQAEVAAITDQ